MRLSKEQLKGRLKNIANQNNADARMLLRQFMLERFLERLSLSRYKDNFVIKGGMLVTSLIGIALRSTMDIDTTISGFDLTIDETRATCEKRETNNLLKDSYKIITDIKNSEELKSHWMNYKKKYRFAAKNEFEHTVESVEYLVGLLKK